MDPRDFVKKNYMKLGKAISPNVESVVAFLFSKGVITQHMKENLIDNNNPKHKKAWALLDLIVTRGSRALDYLYNAVVSEQMYEAADILKPENAPHEINMVAQSQPQTEEHDSPDEGLPDSWPSTEATEAYKTARLVEVKHKKIITLFKTMLTPKGQEFTYLMSAKPRGQVLIINNEEFTHQDNRYGSIEDRKSLEKLFNSLDFDVKVEENKTKEEMWKLLEEESRRDYHNTAQCFLLFILSHGHTGVVFGTDGQMIDGQPVNCLEIRDITDLFSRSKALQGKPKLFFIQACQGGAKNEGHPVGQADGGDRTVSQQPAAAVPAASSSASEYIRLSDEEEIEQIKIISEAKTTLSEVISTTQADAAGDKRPSGADVFVALATIPGQGLPSHTITRVVDHTISHNHQSLGSHHLPQSPSPTITSVVDQFSLCSCLDYAMWPNLPGFLAYRNEEIGTWFIQAICYVFAKYAYKHELNKLMILVNNLVGRAETETGRYKQVCEKKDSFQKEFYFFPGLQA